MAGMIIQDGACVEQFYYRCAPDPGYIKHISPEALKVNGHTLEEIRTWPDRFMAFRTLIELLDKHCNKYDNKDKFVLAGHNVPFDKAMLEAMAKRQQFDYLFSYIDYHTLDTAALAMLCRLVGISMPESNKLENLCNFFKIPLKAHNAWEDIVATRALCGVLMKLLRPAQPDFTPLASYFQHHDYCIDAPEKGCICKFEETIRQFGDYFKMPGA
jgi:DNA polymerase III epsilon subunit-like protein